MAKLSFGAYPHMLGFEQLEQLLERTAKSSNEKQGLQDLFKLVKR